MYYTNQEYEIIDKIVTLKNIQTYLPINSMPVVNSSLLYMITPKS